MQPGKLEILYVEDNEDYISFVKRALKKIDENIELRTVTDGQSALEYVSSRTDNDTFKLIMLDINLPGITGIELLKRFRQEEGMALTPIIMFSTSDNPADVKRSYDNGANAYMIKPIGIAPLTESLKSMYDFWVGYNYAKN